jgi:hypothetical protein
MSQLIDYNPNEIDNAVDRRLALKSAHTIWYNPREKMHYLDRTNSPRPNYDIPMADFGEYLDNKERTKGASSATIEDSLRFAHIKEEFQDLYVQMYDTWKSLGRQGKAKSAGVITMKDYPAIANQIVSQETLDLTVRDFSLEGNASTTKTATTIEIALPDRITGALWSTDLGEFDISDTVNIAYAAATTTLRKAQVHVASSVWVNMVERRHDVVADTLRLARAEEPRIMEQAIGTILSGFTDTAAGGGWGTIGATAFHSTTNPLVLIYANQNLISAAGGEANTLVMSPLSYQTMINNTFMSGVVGTPMGYGQPVSTPTSSNTRVVNHPKLPGYSIVISRAVADGLVFQFDKQTVWSITGPTRTGTYEKNPGYVEGTILDRWYGAAIVEPTLGREITGMTA